MPPKRRRFQRPLGERRYRKLFVIAVEGVVEKRSAETINEVEDVKRDSYAIELGIIQDLFEDGRINRAQMRQLRRNVYVMQVDADSGV